jgi:hypothetical protein
MYELKKLRGKWLRARDSSFTFDICASSENQEESDLGRDLNFADRLVLIACFLS